MIDEREANLRYFKLNKKYPLYDELKKIISKTLGVEAKLSHLVDGFKGIECAFIFGSMAADKENELSDIDLMLIGEANQDTLIKKINQLEGLLNREINYHIYRKDEISKKMKEKNDFIVKIFKDPKIILKGNLNEFTNID